MSSLHRQRILIVEDEPVTALRLGALVERLGREVVGPTASVPDALALVEANEPDAALLDVNLAGIPVYALADRLARREVPFAFLTGHVEAVPPAHADRPVLAKPASAGEVTRVLDALCAAPELEATPGPPRHPISA